MGGRTGLAQDEVAGALLSVAEGSRDAVLLADPDGTVTWANTAAADLLGVRVQELTGRQLAALLPAAAAEELQARLAALAVDRDSASLSVRWRRGDGRTFPAVATLTAVRDPDRALTAVGCTLRAAAEHEVGCCAQDEHRARFDDSPVSQVVLDRTGTVVAANAAAAELVGRHVEDLLGRPGADLLATDDRRAVVADMARLLRGEADHRRGERWVRRSDGRLVPTLLDLRAVRDADGPARIVAFAHDLTEVREAQHRLAVQESRFAALARLSNDVALVTDADLRVEYVSPSVTTTFGYRVEDVVGRSGWDFTWPEDHEGLRLRLAAVLGRPGRAETYTSRVLDAHGQWRWVEGTLSNYTDNPDIDGIVLNLRDVGERVDALRALRQSESRYRAIVHAAHEGICVVGPHGETLSANRKLAEILDVALEEVYAGLVPDALYALAAEVRGGSDPRAVLQREITTRRPGADERVLSVSASMLRLDEGTTPAVLLMVSDVTAARRNERTLRWQALHDPLTGVANRVAFHARLRDVVAGRAGGTVALLYLDLDNLKVVNDSHGHEVGDQLLREVAARLGRVAGPETMVARLGGDEFVVLAEGLDETAARALAEAVTVSLAAPVAQLPEPVYAAASIGVAVAPPCDPASLVECADIAMYRAKTTPGVRVSVYDAGGGDRSVRTMAVVNAVRRALGRQEVELHYQPIIDLRTGAMTGVEALLRHTDDRLGPVPAAEFAAVAERYGWTVDLDRLVMRTACTDLVRLRAAGREQLSYVSVNVSPSTPGGRLRELAVDALDRSGLPSSSLMLEVTENTVMDDADAAIRWLRELREHGIRIAVDDFGTGYSSLARLHRLPLHVLKVDRSFVQAALSEKGALEITRSIVLLGKSFGLRTIAEGVETEAQAEAMRELGCDLAQGYLWSPAVPVSALC
ncbi:MAG: EAL domain-containing protein [Nocardioidaceae bacterium]